MRASTGWHTCRCTKVHRGRNHQFGLTLLAPPLPASQVVVWGKVPGGDAAPGHITSMSSLLNPSSPLGVTDMGGSSTVSYGGSGSSSSSGGRVQAGVVPGLPRITHIAAGTQHLVMSDGERVWVVGRTLDAAGNEVLSTPWHAPKVKYFFLGGWCIRLGR